MPTAILVHSYCMAESKPYHLTPMTRMSAVKAAEVMRKGEADFIMLSSAYNTWKHEDGLKKAVLVEHGVSLGRVETVAPVKDSFDELEKAHRLVKVNAITDLIIVAEEWHAPRAFKIARAMFPSLKVSVVTFKTPKFERALEPHPIKLLGWIKSVRAGFKPFWVAWNLSMLFLTPLMLFLRKKK